MALNINTNVPSLQIQQRLGITQGRIDTSLERLSTGLRINSAKDDAAGLAIATRLSTQILWYRSGHKKQQRRRVPVPARRVRRQ